MYYCVAIASDVFEVINILSTVHVPYMYFLVPTEMLVLNRNDLASEVLKIVARTIREVKACILRLRST